MTRLALSLLALSLTTAVFSSVQAQTSYQVFLPAVLRFCDGVNCAIGDDPVRCEVDCEVNHDGAH